MFKISISTYRAIRELAAKALHNLTPFAPEYMANTGRVLLIIVDVITV